MIRFNSIVVIVAVVALSAALVQCKSRKAGRQHQSPQNSPQFRIADDAKGLVFVYYDPESKAFKRVRSRDAIPKSRRHAVIVSDPLRSDFPPSGKVVVADMRAPQKDGYAYRLVAEDQVGAVFNIKAPKPIQRTVRMFSTTTCPVCTRARSYLTTQKIPFKEYLLDQSPAARALLQKLARSANYKGDLSSVPMFVIAGRVLRGFNPKQIDLLLGIR